MPIIKSAKKRMRQNEKRRLRNKALRTYMKNLKKKSLLEIEKDGADIENASQALNFYKSKVDKAWSKGIYKRNKASRLKSEMERHLKKKFQQNES